MERSIPKMLVFIVMLNLMDCFFTLYGYMNHYIAEINPLNNYLLQYNWIYFFIFKIITTLFLLLAFNLKGAVNIYLKFYGAALLILVLFFVLLCHFRWMWVIFI